MRKALTLIELIFTIVIITFTFMVIPKIFQISNKTLSFSSKEDAIFNMYSQMMDIVLKEYDEENTKYDDILLSGNGGILECNATTGYRTGGFIGSRNCFNRVYESSIGPDTGEPPYDDIDDYNGTDYNISSGHKIYEIKINVGYTDNWDSYNDKSLNYTFTNRSDDNKSQIKKVEVKIFSDKKEISSLKYYSANIGHIEIKSITW